MQSRRPLKRCRIVLTAGALALALPAAGESRVTEAVSQYLAGRSVAGIAPRLHASKTFPLEPPVVDSPELDSLLVPLPPPPSAAVRVTGMRWDSLQRQLEFHLECSAVAACRPFLATLRTPDGKVPPGLPGLAPPAVGNERMQGHRSIPSTRTEPLVRAGEHVRLVITGPGIRMKIPAVCLDPGILGQIVRVRSIEDPKLFHAQVIGAGLLATAF